LDQVRARLGTISRMRDIKFVKEKVRLHLGAQHAVYYAEAMRAAGMARTLLLRCGDRLSRRSRWVLRRLARIESMPSIIWLMLRGLPRFRSSSETVGFEWSLYLPSLLWGRMVRAGIDSA